MNTLHPMLAKIRQFPGSTARLRTIKQAIMAATSECPGCVTHRVSLHFFEDCWLGYHEKSNTGSYPKTTYKVYSINHGATWLPYNDQFEPKEGEHRGFDYEPSDSPFPTRQW